MLAKVMQRTMRIEKFPKFMPNLSKENISKCSYSHPSSNPDMQSTFFRHCTVAVCRLWFPQDE